MGWQHIEFSLSTAISKNRVALIPFLTAGYPDPKSTVDMVLEMESAGVDLVELGIPFSDPLADGATIQNASFHAIKAGMTFSGTLQICAELRRKGLKIPIVLMGYYNPILSYGIGQAVKDAASAGVDGFIVADLPAEEAEPIQNLCSEFSMAWIPLLAPTSTGERIKLACSKAHGFVYCVSLTGVTGARSQIFGDVEGFVSRVRACTNLPLAVGFGISRREQVVSVSKYADAAVVGSALLDIVCASESFERITRIKKFLSGLISDGENVTEEGHGASMPRS
jgi:tryptophan synthase alpha subunit